MISSTALGDPDKFMKYIFPHLEANRGLRESGISVVLNLLDKFGHQLPPKCFILIILRKTARPILFKLCVDGLWNFLWKWLQEGLKTNNSALLTEVLNIYKEVPITMDLITKNQCPKTINKIAKESNDEMGQIARSVVKQWKSVIRDAAAPKSDSGGPGDAKKTADLHEEPKKRAPTVKVLPSGARTAGIEDADEKLKVKSRAEVLRNKGIGVKTVTIKEDLGALPIESYHQSVKVNAEKRKLVEIKESSAFFDSLKTATTKEPIKKKRKILSKQLKKSSEAAEDSSVVSNGLTLKSSLADIDMLLNIDKKQKKRVSWAEGEDLNSFHYFELDENERVNVNRMTMDELRRWEHNQERQHIQSKMVCVKGDADAITGQKWYTPPYVDGSDNGVEPGVNSVEKNIQAEREKDVLQVLYLTKDSIPSSAAEPDHKSQQGILMADDHPEPVPIPLKDLTFGDTSIPSEASNPSSSIIITSQQDNGKTQVTLNPELANLLKSITENMQPVSSSEMSSAPPPATTQSQHFGSHIPSELGEYDAVRARMCISQLLLSKYPDLPYEELTLERVRELLDPYAGELQNMGIPCVPDDFYFVYPHLGVLPYPPHAVPPHLRHPSMRMPRPGGSFPLGPPHGVPPPAFGGPMPLRRMPPPPMPVGGGMGGGGPPGSRNRPVCRYFASGRPCIQGSQCAFLHSAPGQNRMRLLGPPSRNNSRFARAPGYRHNN